MWFYVPTVTAKCYFEMQMKFWLRDFSENGIVYKEALKEISPMGKGFVVPCGGWKGDDCYLSVVISPSASLYILHLCLLVSMSASLSVHPSIYPMLRSFLTVSGCILKEVCGGANEITAVSTGLVAYMHLKVECILEAQMAFPRWSMAVAPPPRNDLSIPVSTVSS